MVFSGLRLDSELEPQQLPAQVILESKMNFIFLHVEWGKTLMLDLSKYNKLGEHCKRRIYEC